MFNLAIDPIIRKAADLAATHGYALQGQHHSVLAYADDLVLASSNTQKMQELLDEVGEEASRLGLQFNASKCASLHIDGKKRTTVATPFTIHKGTPVIMEEDDYKHLGIPTGYSPFINPETTTEEISKALEDINTSRLAPWQKLEAVSVFLTPRLSFLSKSGLVRKAPLTELDQRIIQTMDGSRRQRVHGDLLPPVQARRTEPIPALPTPLQTAREKKIEKYKPLAEELTAHGYEVHNEAFVVGSLGSFHPNNFKVAKSLGINNSYAKLMAKYMVSETIRWGRDIYTTHVTGTAQSKPRNMPTTETFIPRIQPLPDTPIDDDIQDWDHRETMEVNGEEFIIISDEILDDVAPPSLAPTTQKDRTKESAAQPGAAIAAKTTTPPRKARSEEATALTQKARSEEVTAFIRKVRAEEATASTQKARSEEATASTQKARTEEVTATTEEGDRAKEAVPNQGLQDHTDMDTAPYVRGGVGPIPDANRHGVVVWLLHIDNAL